MFGFACVLAREREVKGLLAGTPTRANTAKNGKCLELCMAFSIAGDIIDLKGIKFNIESHYTLNSKTKNELGQTNLRFLAIDCRG